MGVKREKRGVSERPKKDGKRKHCGSQMVTVHATKLQRPCFESAWRPLLHVYPSLFALFPVCFFTVNCQRRAKMPETLSKKKMGREGVEA